MPTSIIEYDDYVFTKDYALAIKPTNLRTIGSTFLYVRTDYEVAKGTALSSLIHGGFIVEDGIENVETKPTRKIRSGETQFIYPYRKYKFYRELIDKRKYAWDENRQRFLPDYNDLVSMNENDCLKYGECLTIANKTDKMDIFNEMIARHENPPVLKPKHSSTSISFGESPTKNIDLLKDIKKTTKNNHAIPENGESYAIVRKEGIEDFSDYHIAFVLYTHDDVNITLEAAADAASEYLPAFSFYDTKPSNQYTFHKVHGETYSNGETIVLESRPIDVVLSEIRDELDMEPESPPKKKTKHGGRSRRKSHVVKTRFWKVNRTSKFLKSF